MLTGCTFSKPANVQQYLKVDSPVRSQYHNFAINYEPGYQKDLSGEVYADFLFHDGFIVGLEKADKALLSPNMQGPSDEWGRQLLNRRFSSFAETGLEAGIHPAQLEKLDNELDKVIDDKSQIFVSHVIAYQNDRDDTDIRTSAIYNIYNDTELNNDVAEAYTLDRDIYEEGWIFLETQLKNSLQERLAVADHGYTHIVVGAMGWDNNQQESIRDYNGVLNAISWCSQDDMNCKMSSSNEHRDRGILPDKPIHSERFKPLFIGITWPSVWGRKDSNSFIRSITKLLSYPNKANDADELAYTYVNWLLNNLALEMGRKFRLPVMAFGHSFGARIITRAVFSGHLLNDAIAYSEGIRPNLVVGLQGAFSANRIIGGKFQIDGVGDEEANRAVLGHGAEGAPYAHHAAAKIPLILTGSRNDKANGVARYVSGAEHVGGLFGVKRVCSEAGRKQIVHVDFMNFEQFDHRYWQDGRYVLYVDATEEVDDHNHIRTKATGELIWRALELSEEGARHSSAEVLSPLRYSDCLVGK